MRCRSRHLRAVVLLGWVAAAAVAKADEPPSVPPAKTTSASPAAQASAAAHAPITEVKPEVFYIRDKDNRLVPVPGFTYDDFVKYYRLKEQLDRPEVKPRFNLEQMTVDGTAEANRAELTVLLKVLLLDSDWVRIPLRMNRFALREPAGYKGAGDQLLQFEPNGDGYVCWLRGSPRSEHELTLKFLLPLAAAAGENRLELTLPRSSASKLTLRVPTANVAATTSAVNSLPEVAADGGGSQISVLGVGGDFWLTWREPNQPALKLSSALEATGLIFIKIDGRSVSSEALLSVRSFGEEFDRFRVRLPAGSLLARGQHPGYTLTRIGKPDTSIVEVKLDRKTVGPVEIQLLTERAYDVTKVGENLDLAGFAIPEAIPHRQWGHMAVAVSGDWQIVWGDRTRVRQVDELPEGLRRKDLVAGFEYFGQPSSLVARVIPRKTRVSVEPQYTYRVGAEQTDLEARLKYTIRGARLFKLELDLPGWEIDSAGPENLIDENSISTGVGGVVGIPLVQPSTGDLELTLKVHRRNSSGIKAIEWTLPEPRVDVLGPAEVAIIPANNIDLSPQADKLVGLSRSTGPVPPAESQPAPLYYRAEQARARFVADFAVHPQSVTVEMDSQIALHVRQVEVNQVLNYQVRYEPLDRLTVETPRSLFDERKIKFSIAGEAVEAREAGKQPASDRRSLQLPLKQPTNGPIRLEIHFLLPQQNLVSSSSTAIDIPLVVPTDTQVIANLAALTADPGIRIEQREGPWSVIDTPKNAAPQASLRLTAAESAAELRVALSLDEQSALGATFIDRAWIQSWLTETVRQDRAVYNFTSDEDQLRIKLPAGIAASDVELVLDGKAVVPVAGPTGALVVNLATNPSRRDHLLELRYQFESPGAHDGWLSFEVPRFESQVRLGRTYWQLVLPPDENLVGASRDLSAEFNWNWRDFGLGVERVPVKEQRQLEQWAGLSAASNPADSTKPTVASRLGDELPQRTNRYLFSAVGADARFEVVVARRWLLLLAASLATLLVGLSVIYLRPLRRPRVLLTAACVLFIAVLLWPDPAVLLSEAASLGLGLALLALVLQRALERHGAGGSLARGAAPAMPERSSQRFHYRPSDDAKAATTTASIAVEVAAVEPTAVSQTETGVGPEQEISGSSSGIRDL